jgi:hypothetical protein
MRATLALCALAALTAGVSAQTLAGNHYRTWDQTTEYTSRGSNAGSKGHLSQGYTVACIGGAKTVKGMQFVLQDQDAATQEPFNFGFCGMAASGTPDYRGTTRANYVTNYLLPVGSGIQAWMVTFTPTQPVKLPQNCEETHHCWEFVNTTNWSTDGVGVHMSQAGPQMLGTPTNTEVCYFFSGYGRVVHREIPRTDPAAPVLNGNRQIQEMLGMSEGNPGPGPTIHLNRSWVNDMGFTEPTLMGSMLNKAYNAPNVTNTCFDPNTGYAGQDPDLNNIGLKAPVRLDDYNYILNSDTGQFGLMFFSNTLLCPGAPTPFGTLHVNPGDLLFNILGPVPMGAITGGTVSFKLFGGLGPQDSFLRKFLSSTLNLSAQALAFDTSGTHRLSNVFTFRGTLDGRIDGKVLTTGHATRGTATGTTGTVVSKGVTDNVFYFRNDGHTVMSVQPMLNNVARGPATKVPTRGMVLALTAPGTNQLKFTFRGASKQDFTFSKRAF